MADLQKWCLIREHLKDFSLVVVLFSMTKCGLTSEGRTNFYSLSKVCRAATSNAAGNHLCEFACNEVITSDEHSGAVSRTFYNGNILENLCLCGVDVTDHQQTLGFEKGNKASAENSESHIRS